MKQTGYISTNLQYRDTIAVLLLQSLPFTYKVGDYSTQQYHQNMSLVTDVHVPIPRYLQ